MPSEKKLSPQGFLLAANARLSGTNMLEAFNQITLGVDGDGNIKEHVLENIKTSLRVGAQSAEELVAQKFQHMLEFLGDY